MMLDNNITKHIKKYQNNKNDNNIIIMKDIK